jgi:hypothetical protein
MKQTRALANSFLWGSVLGLLLPAGPVDAGEAPFYQGKTITLIAVDQPGGTGDLRTRVVTQFLQKHLPGNPNIVMQYIPNDVLAANTLANVAKRDGLTLGRVNSSVYANAIFGAEGARYKLSDFSYFGGAEAGGPYLLILRPGLGIDSVEKLKAYKGLRFANRNVGHTMYILDRMMAFTLDLKEPKWILGYNSQEIRLAMERGEADAQSNSIPSFMRGTQHWLKEGFTIPLIMKNIKGRGAEVAPGFPQDRPSLDQFTDTEFKKAVLRFHNSIRPSGTVFVAPKGIPDPALRALGEAFNRVWSDPQFAKEFARVTKEQPDPVTGEEVDRVLEQAPKDRKIMEVYRQIIGAGPLPSSR